MSEQIREKAERQVAAVEAVLARWDDVLREVKAADPRWILDQGVMVLGQVRNEVQAALDLRPPLPVEPTRHPDRVTIPTDASSAACAACDGSCGACPYAAFPPGQN